jgi:hypothetical protein
VADIQFYGTGRRKSATARVYLRPGSGEFQVNRSPIDAYFKNETLRMIIRQPLQLTDTLGKFDVLVNVEGGGCRWTSGCRSSRDRSSALRIQHRIAQTTQARWSFDSRPASQGTQEVRPEGCSQALPVLEEIISASSMARYPHDVNQRGVPSH